MLISFLRDYERSVKEKESLFRYGDSQFELFNPILHIHVSKLEAISGTK